MTKPRVYTVFSPFGLLSGTVREIVKNYNMQLADKKMNPKYKLAISSFSRLVTGKNKSNKYKLIKMAAPWKRRVKPCFEMVYPVSWQVPVQIPKHNPMFCIVRPCSTVVCATSIFCAGKGSQIISTKFVRQIYVVLGQRNMLPFAFLLRSRRRMAERVTVAYPHPLSFIILLYPFRISTAVPWRLPHGVSNVWVFGVRMVRYIVFFIFISYPR